MKRTRSLSLVFAILIGLAVGLGGAPQRSLADDTEIYLGAANLKAGIRPNVLFILDTSGSMSATVTGTGMDRLDNMKVAIKKVLDGATNINVGLMRFHDPGGPILFPVSYIDEDVNVIEGTTDVTDLDVNVQIDQSSDDAEETKSFGVCTSWWLCSDDEVKDEWNTTPGDVTLDSPVLDVYELQTAAALGGTDLVYRIENGADDAEENAASGTVLLDGFRLGIGYDSGDQAVGLRFPSVEIPPGATILSAELAFVAKEDRSGTGFTLEITGHKSTNPGSFTTTPFNVTGRPRTAAVATWTDPEPWVTGATDRYATPDIKNVVQELVNQGSWASGNPMAFIIEHASGSSGSDSQSRKGHTYESNITDAPWLRITYTTENTSQGYQTIGLRFRNVGVPQGAKIQRAYLEFRPDAKTGGETSVQIFGHDVGDSPTFTDIDNELSKRYDFFRTATSVDWDIEPWTPGIASQSPDIGPIVQEIVDRGDWCGNNAMSFLIRPRLDLLNNGKVGPRIANSFDSDPTNAPILRIEYDETSVIAGACIDQWVQRQVDGTNNDAEQVLSNGTIDITSTDLDFDFKKMSGMRFLDIPVARNQTILEARLVFTADTTQTGLTDLKLYGQYHDDAPPFLDAQSNLSARAPTAASVTWSPADQTAGVEYMSPDIKSVIQEIINHPSWMPGNSLVLFEKHVSGAARREKTFDDDPIKAPKLLLRVQGVLATAGAGQNSVRNVLKEIVDNLDHVGHTPVVDTLFEAARYYRGDDVMYGHHRGWERDLAYADANHPDNGNILTPKPNASSTNDNVRRNTRVSHPASWTGGTIVRTGNCVEEDLNDVDCRAEYVDGNPIYNSPITSSCQSNYIILLTDGIANHNHSEQAIMDYIGLPSCAGGTGEKACGLELVKWLHDEDQLSVLDGDQHVFTYTIGFNFSDQWLADLAVVGGGRFHEADTADDLVREVTQIFADIMNRSTSFAAPTLSVNAFNKLFHRSDVYFSLFKPSAAVSWDGNLKKYQLCQSSAAGCDLGEVLDVKGVPAVEKDPTSEAFGRIADSAISFWPCTDASCASPADGSEIKVGGAGLQILAPASRKVLTYTGTTPPDYTFLDVPNHTVATKNDKGILDGIGGALADRRARTQELIGDSSFFTTDDDREELFDWMLGEDIHGLEDVPSLSAAGRRFAFNDPLHSSAVAVTFGGTDADPVLKLFVGTNDGGLRAINSTTGVEEWIWYPQATLKNQMELKDNFAGKHIYGLDGNPSVWLNDRNGNGVIEPGSDANSDGFIDETEGDFVRLFIGMRRGGRNLYALDVTPSAALTVADKDQIDDIPPTYMWRIEGGVGNYIGLGQTWSTPKITKIVFGTNTAGETVSKTALVFAGGYDTLQDGGFGPGGDGNGIYFVDPYDGSLLFVISGRDHGVSQQLVVSEMQYPIPSDLALMDTDGDDATDRILVGDTGGQMWRIDISPDLAASQPDILPVVGKLAEVSNNLDPADRRKFFYPPDVVRVTDGAYSSSGAYDLVVAVTGNRAHPLDEAVQNRIFAFRDSHMAALVDGDPLDPSDDDGIADGYTTLLGQLVDPARAGDLLDVTDTVDFSVDPAKANIEAADGWYINLEANGEKGLAPPVILGGQLFFTTYISEDVIDAANCSIIEGVGRLYGLNVLTGAASQNWDGVGDDTNLTKSDRNMSLGSGIPSQAVPIFQPEGVTLLIGGGGGATSVNPNIGLPRVRTYWVSEGG